MIYASRIFLSCSVFTVQELMRWLQIACVFLTLASCTTAFPDGAVIGPNVRSSQFHCCCPLAQSANLLIVVSPMIHGVLTPQGKPLLLYIPGSWAGRYHQGNDLFSSSPLDNPGLILVCIKCMLCGVALTSSASSTASSTAADPVVSPTCAGLDHLILNISKVKRQVRLIILA